MVFYSIQKITLFRQMKRPININPPYCIIAIELRKGRCSLLHTCCQILRFVLHLPSSVEAISTRISLLAAKKQSLFQIQRHELKLTCELLVLYEKRFKSILGFQNHLHGLLEYARYGRSLFLIFEHE